MDREQFIGRARQLISRVMGNPNLANPSANKEPSPLLVGDTKTIIFKPSYKIGDVLDVNEEDRERETLVKELKAYQDKLLQGPKVPLLPKDKQAFLTSEQKFVAIRDYSAALDEDYAKLIQGDFYYSYLTRYQILGVTAALMMHENTARIIQVADKYSMDPSVRKYNSLQEALFAGTLEVRIGDLTLLDFLYSKAEAKFAPYQIYQFLVGSYEVKEKRKHNQVLAANRVSNSLTQYPNTFKRQVDVAVAMAGALAGCSPYSFDYEIGTYGDNKEVTERARKVVDHAYRLRQNIYSTLLDPNSPHFPKLKETVEAYLTQDRRTRVFALHIIGLKEIAHIYEVYRKALSYTKQGIFPEFYTRLAEAVKNYAEEVPTNEGVLTEDDLMLIIDPEKNPPTSTNVPITDDFSKTIGQIFSKTPMAECKVDVETINWYQMVPPQNVTLSFNPNAPKHFSIKFDYQNEEGESLSLNFSGDLRKNLLDWSFIEKSTETPEFSNLHHSLLFITQAILLEVQKQAQAIYDQRQRDKVKKPNAPVQTSEKREKERPKPTMPKRRDVVREAKEQNARLTASELEEIDQLLSSDIKKQLTVLPVEEQSKMLRKLSFEDQSRVFKEIEEYNTTQVGKFLPLKRRGPNGEILWSLDISSRVPGRIRALATLSESGDKLIKFTILDIDYRKDIYRSWHI